MLRGGDETRTMYVVMFTTNSINDTTTNNNNNNNNTATATIITTNTKEEHPIKVPIGSPDRQSRSAVPIGQAAEEGPDSRREQVPDRSRPDVGGYRVG